jgi:Cro/C1-type HTH DNA-binding domain
MQIHQGKLLKEKIARSRMKVQDVARDAKLAPSSLYDMYKKSDVPRTKLKTICSIIHADIRDFYVDLFTIPGEQAAEANLFSEEQAEYSTSPDIELLRQRCIFLQQEVKHLNTIVDLLKEKLAVLQSNK